MQKMAMVKIVSKEPLNYKFVIHHEQQQFDQMKSFNCEQSYFRSITRPEVLTETLRNLDLKPETRMWKNDKVAEKIISYMRKSSTEERTQDNPNKPGQLDDDRKTQISNRFYIFLRSIFLKIV